MQRIYSTILRSFDNIRKEWEWAVLVAGGGWKTLLRKLNKPVGFSNKGVNCIKDRIVGMRGENRVTKQ